MYEANALYLLCDDLQWIVNSRNKEGASAIHFAAGDGSVSRMQLLCNAGLCCLLSSIFFSSLFLSDENAYNSRLDAVKMPLKALPRCGILLRQTLDFYYLPPVVYLKTH